MTNSDELLPLDAALRGLLALEVVKREERLGSPDERPTALVLADAGLQAPAIAVLTNRNVGAVRKAIERARKKEAGR
jgi:DNA-directed RNA polymerase specialized sigma24 family protein